MKRTPLIQNGIRRAAICVALIVFSAVLMMQTFPVLADASEPAVDPVRNNDNYSAVVYDNTNGLPAAEANDIAQTSEGFIWIGCYAGLVRYDGSTFERLDSTNGVNSISCLYVDKNDRLWIGTNDNGIALMENGEFRFWDEKDGLGSSKITDIEGDTDGNIYVGTTEGIAMINSDLELIPLKDRIIKDMYLETMVSDDDGLIYGTSHDGNVFIMRDGNLVNYYEREESEHNIGCVYPDRKKPGWIYYGTEDGGVYHCNLKSGFDSAEYIDISPLVGVYSFKQIGDYLWVCTRNGAGVIADDGFHSLDYLPLNNSVDNVMMDYEGNLWFTSSRRGVMKLVANRFIDVFARYGIESSVVNTTCMLGKKLFIGSDNGLIVTDETGVADSVPLTSVRKANGQAPEESQNASDLLELLDGVRIRSIIRDSRDRLWISTWRSHGLLRYDNGELTIFDESDGLLSGRVRSVYETSDGRMLVAVTGGLNIIDGDQVIAAYEKDDGLINIETLYTCEAPNGDILIGSNGDGIYVLNNEGISNIGKDAGLTSGVVMRISYDEKNKVFWLITGNSIAYMTESYKLTTVSKFPYPDNLDMAINSKGDMWILSSNGIYIASTEEMLNNKATDPVHYGIANGLSCIATSNPYNYLTKDGDLYISGRTGVVKVNIEEPLEQIGNIKMSVPFIEADDKLIYPNRKGIFHIPASTKKLAVHAHVYNYSLTDPLVLFHLRGFERVESAIRSSALDAIYYTNLQGGTYRFDMRLKDALGSKSKLVTATIIKERAFYEQAWFFALALGLFTAASLAGLQLYVRTKISKLEERHREQAEKDRVTGELHMASKIQSSILPHEFPPFPDRNEFDIYASMDPAREVGGDFYDFFMKDEDHLCMVIADVSGKGIPASLFMMNAKVILKSFALSSDSPAEVLEKTNTEICSNNLMEMFVTVWLGILEISSGKLVAANAGHEYPVIGHANGSYEIIKDKHGFVIGGMDGVKYTDYELQLEPGDILFVYTDGVPEAENKNKDMFGTEHMLATLNANSSDSPEDILAGVRGAVAEFINGAEPFDDLTMLGMIYKGSQHTK